MENPGIALGALMAEATLAGRDKCRLVTDEPVAALGLWVEQLVAESTGKAGRGVLPVVGENTADLSGAEPDRVLVVTRRRCRARGRPAIRVDDGDGLWQEVGA